jgi:hypothetical protein
MTECDLQNWCQLVVYNGTAGHPPSCGFSVDANWHTFTLTWSASLVSIAMDGKSTGCSYTNKDVPMPAAPMFLIIQTQTGGVGGTPNNALLPATFAIDYVKVTQP